jgi:predicted ATPase
MCGDVRFGDSAEGGGLVITRIEVLNYRCLRYVSLPLDRFRLLVGPNASGKSTLMDVLTLIRDVLTPEIQVAKAMSERSEGNPLALAWLAKPSEVQLAVELAPPAGLLPEHPSAAFRYELAINVQAAADPEIAAEALFLYREGMPRRDRDREQRLLFPESARPPEGILHLDEGRIRNRQKVVSKARDGKDYYQWRVRSGDQQPWNQSVYLGRSRAALAYLPVDERDENDPFRKADWVRQFLTRGIVDLHLDIEALRRPSPPSSERAPLPDGSNMAWAARDLLEQHPAVAREWLQHVGTLIPALVDVSTEVRDFDRHCVLRAHYANGAAVPSWLVSDGTLRLLALTLFAYYPHGPSVYLVEEPENGIHPAAVDGLMGSLSSMWDDQVLVATHSLALLAGAGPGQVLCFGLGTDGATDITLGERHPCLVDWQSDWNLADITASGILA